MKRLIIPLTACAALALYSFGPGATARTGEANAASPATEQSSSCTHEGKDYQIGEAVCIENMEYQCTSDGFVSTGNGC